MTDNWTLRYKGWAPEQEPLREALCTLGNGIFATRGAAEEARADGVHYPGTYFIGGYNRLESEIAGKTIINEDLVNFPNWLPIVVRPEGGSWLDPGELTCVEYRQELLVREGVLVRTYRVRDGQNRETMVQSRRFVHMGYPHLAAIAVTVTPINWSGRLEARSLLDGSVVNGGVERYRELNSNHLEMIQSGSLGSKSVFLHVRTTQSHLEVVEAARTSIARDDEELDVEIQLLQNGAVVGQGFLLDVHENEPVHIEKVVALFTSRDQGITEVTEDASLAIERSGRFDDLRREHEHAWGELWRQFDVEIDVDPDEDCDDHPIQLVLRLHVFHLLQTASFHTIGRDVSVPARGLHGEAYRGHIFWDEAYIFPFYNLRAPQITRSLLLYRYQRLSAARAYARKGGCQGALFPWQSGSNGREETQVIHLNPRSGKWDPDHSRLQRHINAACAYNVWKYFVATDDRVFLERYGAEMLLEIARFWASLAVFNPEAGCFEIEGVMGPDEYHEKYPDIQEGGLKNNAYTNLMAVWCIERALEVLNILPPGRRDQLVKRLGIGTSDLEQWRKVTGKMALPIRGDGIIEQFEGYDKLDEFDWDRYSKKYGNIGRLDRILRAEGDSPDHYKVSKQADLCMLFYLLDDTELEELFAGLGYHFDSAVLGHNVEYYLQRTSHGSTLSYVVFSALLDRIDRQKGWQYFRKALRSDVADIQGGTTPEGIHAAMMAGTVRIVLENYAGVSIQRDGVHLCPRLPTTVRSVRFPLRHRGNEMIVHVTPTEIRLIVDEGAALPIPVVYRGKHFLLAPGQTEILRQ